MGNKRLTWMVLLALIVLGFGIRSLCFREVFQGDRVYFYANDSWYHMRRIVYAVKNNFSLSDYPKPDPYLNYPEGGQGYWGPLFDLGIAGLIKTFGVESRQSQEAVAAVVPAFLGGLCVLAVFLIASVFWNKITAFAAAFFMAFMPGHIFYSQLGNLDHHVAESLFFGLILAVLLSLPLQTGKKIRLLTALASVLILALYLVTPSTSNIHMGVIWAACLAQILILEEPRENEAAAKVFIISGALLLIPAVYWLLQPVSGIRLWGDLPRWLMIEWYSFLQPALILFGGLLLFIAARLKKGDKSPIFWALAGFSLLLLIILMKPLLAGTAILFKNNPDLKFTSEAQPFLRPAGTAGVHFGVAFASFGYFFLLFPLWWWHVWQKEPKTRSLLIAFAALFALLMLQLRFVYVFAYANSIALGWLVSEASKHKKLWMAAAMLLVFLMWPSLKWIHNFYSRREYATVPEAAYTALQWLKNAAPNEQIYSKSAPSPSHSVMAIWDLGHAIVYLSEQAVVSDPFNHGFEISAKYFTATDPYEATDILKERRVRYIIPIDFTNEYVLKAYAGYARLPESHPLKNGEWFRIFQTQLLMGLNPPGPDGKPSSWGHRLIYQAADNSLALYEFDPAALNVNPRRK